MADNSTGYQHLSQCPYNYCVEDTIYRIVMGTLLFVIVWPFVVQDMKWFPLGRPAAALLGATLMVVFNITPQGQVYHVLGDRGNLQTICLLVGMMMLSYYYDREGLLRIVALWIFRKGKRFQYILWKVCVLSAVMSALVTNDAACVVLTPLLLSEHTKQKRSLREIAPLLLGIATSANIGSASTFFGNPQNAYIASQTNLSLLIFFVSSLPAAIVGIFINTGLLYLMYYKVVVVQDNSAGSDCAVVPTEQTCVSVVSNGLITPPTTSMSTESHREEQEFRSNPHSAWSNAGVERVSRFHNTQPKLFENTITSSLPVSDSAEGSLSRRECDTSFSGSIITDIHYGATNTRESHADTGVLGSRRARRRTSSVTNRSNKSIRERSLCDKVFIVWLGLVTLLVIIVLAIPPLDSLTFNLGLVPVGAAALSMLADTLIHRQHASNVMTSIDWTLILLFCGLFVWLAGFENTSLPRRVFEKTQGYMNLSTVPGVLLFTVFVIVGSNILSNVPLVILIIDELGAFECGLDDCSQLTGILLAWVSTVAGNFTLIGSVANLIVAEKARSCADYRLTFWEYLKFGIPSTLLVLFTGLPVIYFTGKYVNISV